MDTALRYANRELARGLPDAGQQDATTEFGRP
jgi:hypothetical protein